MGFSGTGTWPFWSPEFGILKTCVAGRGIQRYYEAGSGKVSL